MGVVNINVMNYIPSMGRKPGKLHDVPFQVWMARNVVESIRDAAKASGQSASAWVRQAIAEKLKRDQRKHGPSKPAP